MRNWGFDPISWRALKMRPFPLKPVRDRVSALDYPGEALVHGIEVDAIIRLDVAPNGRVSQCKELNPGAYRGFENAACDVLKGARFKPALDSSGNPVPAPVIYDVRFRIGG
jgi:protein TonB